jgi:hypothetical protein
MLRETAVKVFAFTRGSLPVAYRTTEVGNCR